MDQFDIPGFILTLKDGTKYLIEREHVGDYFLMGDDVTSGTTFIQSYGKASLKQITDNNGNRLEFNDNGIQSYNADGEKTKSIVFDRDAANGNRITAIYAPSSLNEDGTKPEGAIPQFKYEYDAKGNLAKVHKLIDRTKPVDQQYAVTEYLYENADRPHYVTAIKDALGNTPMKCIYDEDGRLIATEDANGNRIAMNHDLTGRTETITDRMGNPTIHTFDDMGNVTATIDAQGNTTKYSYDNLGNKLSETNALGYTTSYTYDAQGNQTSVTDALGNVTRYEYDGKGNQTKIVDALGNVTTNAYDSAGNLLSTTDALGNSIKREYDSGRLVGTYDTNGKPVSLETYDSAGNLLSTTSQSGLITTLVTNAQGSICGSSQTITVNGQNETLTSTLEQNDAGQVTSAIDTLGTKSLFSFNAVGKTTSISVNGDKTEFEFDVAGNCIEKRNPDGTLVRFIVDAEGRNVISTENFIPGNATMATRVFYDSLGRTVRKEILKDFTIERNGNVTSIGTVGDIVYISLSSYDAVGNLLTSTDGSGCKTRYEYNAVGLCTAVIDHWGNRFETEYDALGRKVRTKDALGNITSYEYDAIGRTTKTIFPDGSYISNSFDNMGRKISSTDASGITTKFKYDDKNLIAVEKSSDGQNYDICWEYSYDSNGNRTAIKDPNGNVTSFTYDKYHRITQKNLPMGQSEKIEYITGSHKVAKRIDSIGQTVTYSYNERDQLICQKFQGNATSYKIEFTYTDSGLLKKVIEPSQETAYEYDFLGRVIQIQTLNGSINYTYDEITGNKASVETANSKIGYIYDIAGRLSKVIVYKRNATILSEPEETVYNYNKNGSRIGVIYPNGFNTTYEYDELERLVKLSHNAATGELVAEYQYTLAPTGHRIALLEKSMINGALTVTGSVSYQYDGLYRLVREKRTGNNAFDAMYSYDANGNRISKQLIDNSGQNIITYSYNANDQLMKEVSTSDGTTTYSYNPNGALIAKNNSNKFNYLFSYDVRNYLSSVTAHRQEGMPPNSREVNITANYQYDYKGNRIGISQTVDNITSEKVFLIDDGLTGYAQILEEMSEAGGVSNQSYVIGDDLISQATASSINYLLYDGHGSTRHTINKGGDITGSYTYDAYGQMLGGAPDLTSRTTVTDFLYAGEQFDSCLQMEYLRARYYDANTGRFISRDPFAGNIHDPQSLHKYAYCHNDPVNGIDPSGETLISLLINMTITTAISQGISFAVTPIIGRLAEAFLPNSLVSALINGAAPDAFTIGASGSGGLYGIAGSVGLEFGIFARSLEIGGFFNFGISTMNNISAKPSGDLTVNVGLSWGCPTAEDYGNFDEFGNQSLAISYANVPIKYRAKIWQCVANSIANTGKISFGKGSPGYAAFNRYQRTQGRSAKNWLKRYNQYLAEEGGKEAHKVLDMLESCDVNFGFDLFSEFSPSGFSVSKSLLPSKRLNQGGMPITFGWSWSTTLFSFRL